MKKIVALTMAAVLSVSLTACGSNSQETSVEEPVSTNEETQIANPFVSCESLESAEKLAGFDITEPDERPDWITATEFRVIEDQMIELVYGNSDGREMRVRKAKGNEDISGDYTEYKDVEQVSLGERNFTLKGDGEWDYLAIWTKDDFSYSFSISEGMTQDQIITIIDGIK